MSIPKIPISEDRLSPRILFCSHFTAGMQLPKGAKLGERFIYDYEIEYIVDSKDGSMMLDGQMISVKKDEIFFRYPGQRTEGIMPYASYLLCFDLLGTTGRDTSLYNLNTKKSFQKRYQHPMLDIWPAKYLPNNPSYYFALFHDIFEQFIHMEIGSAALIKANLLKILYSLYKELSQPLLIASPYASMLKNTIQYIKNHTGQKLTLKMLAKQSGLSPNYFHSIFTRTMGMTPNEYCTKEKIRKSKELLIHTQKSIDQIAALCGFSTSVYFCMVFKKIEKLTPTQFRKKYTQIMLL